MGNANALGSGPVQFASSSSSLDLYTGNRTVGGLSSAPGDGVILTTNGSRTLTVNQAGDSSFGGAIQSNLSLVKTGAGSLTLSGANAYTGTTAVQAGTLHFGQSSALTAGAGTVESGATLGVSAGGSGEFTGAEVGTRLSALATDGTSGLKNGSTFAINTGNAGGSIVVSDNIATTSTAALQKDGFGTLNFTGDLSYPGDTRINAGTLLINGPNGYSGGGTFMVGSGAQLGGSGDIDGSVIVGAGGIYSPGNSPDSQSVANITFDGGSAYVWDLYDAGPAVGGAANYGSSSWDHLGVTNTLTLNTGAEIRVLGLMDLLGTGGTPGLPLGLDISVKGAQTGPFDILTLTGAVDGTLGFTSIGDLINIPINAGNLGQYGNFLTSISGNTLQLSFVSTVPEPGTWALFGLLTITACAFLRRRRTLQAV